MPQIDLEKYTNQQLCEIVDELNQVTVPVDSIARTAAVEFFGLPKEQIKSVQLVALGLGLAIELAKRLKECQNALAHV